MNSELYYSTKEKQTHLFNKDTGLPVYSVKRDLIQKYEFMKQSSRADIFFGNNPSSDLEDKKKKQLLSCNFDKFSFFLSGNQVDNYFLECSFNPKRRASSLLT